MPTKTDTLEVTIGADAIAAIQKATLEAMRVAQAPENKNPPDAFWNGYGLPDFPKQTTWEKIYFCGAPVEFRQCTKTEAALFNEVRPIAGQYGPEKNIHLSFQTSHGKPSALNIWVAGIKSIEGRMGQPTLAQTLRYIVDEQAVPA